jgi:hypothetical protein
MRWLFLFALVINLCAAALSALPNSMDAYYYFGGALQLARGLGFTEPYVWNYFAPVRSLPVPSHLYWMPLTSIVMAPFIAVAEGLGGPNLPNSTLFRAAQMPMVLAASLLPPLTHAVAQAIGLTRRQAFSAGLLTLFSAFYLLFWNNTDSFGLFAVCGVGAFLAYGQGKWLLAGLLAGLAHLARADGILVLACLIFFHLIVSRPFNLRHHLSVISYLLTGYALIMFPWLARNWLVIGTPLAPNGSRTLWLTDYNELFMLNPATLTLERYLASNWLTGKWEAFNINFQRMVVEQANIFAFPFALVGWWKMRVHKLMQLAALYAGVLFLAMTFAFTFPGPRGGYFHSGAALVPFMAIAAIVGLETGVDFIARYLKHWQPERSKPIFSTLLVLGAVALSALRLVNAARVAPSAAYVDIGVWLQQQNIQAETVMVNDPPRFYFETGHSAIVVPAGPPTDVLQAMDMFGARWLVLDVNIVSQLEPLYDAPQAASGLALRATFNQNQSPIYLFERVP